MSTADLLWARQVVETEQWETREITEETSAPVALATGLAAVQAGDLALARRAEERLGAARCARGEQPLDVQSRCRSGAGVAP